MTFSPNAVLLIAALVLLAASPAYAHEKRRGHGHHHSGHPHFHFHHALPPITVHPANPMPGKPSCLLSLSGTPSCE